MVSFDGLQKKSEATKILVSLLKPQTDEELMKIEDFVELVINSAREFCTEDVKWSAKR